jgi:RNA polymerase sigma-70 factor, ECF subfamily
MHSAPILCLQNSSGASRELDLVRDLRAGSATAYSQLHELYGRRLYRKIYSITRNHEDAEDALQDTLMRAYLSLDSFEGRSKFFSWLTRIAINSALMMLRKRRNRAEVAIELGACSEDESLQLEFKDARPNPEEIYAAYERRHHLSRAVASLSPMFRTVMELQTTRSGSMREIAETLHVTVPTVKARLHRARRRVAERIAAQTGVRARNRGGNADARHPQYAKK